MSPTEREVGLHIVFVADSVGLYGQIAFKAVKRKKSLEKKYHSQW